MKILRPTLLCTNFNHKDCFIRIGIFDIIEEEKKIETNIFVSIDDICLKFDVNTQAFINSINTNDISNIKNSITIIKKHLKYIPENYNFDGFFIDVDNLPFLLAIMPNSSNDFLDFRIDLKEAVKKELATDKQGYFYREVKKILEKLEGKK